MNRSSSILTGAGYGVFLGGALALLYMMMYSLALALANFKPTQPETWLNQLGVTIGVVFVVGSQIGILPAALIGGFTGALIGIVVGLLYDKLSRRAAFIVGVLVSIGIAAPLNLLTFPRPPYAYHDYVFIIAVPSFIYILAEGYIGVRVLSTRDENAGQTGGAYSASRFTGTISTVGLIAGCAIVTLILSAIMQIIRSLDSF